MYRVLLVAVGKSNGLCIKKKSDVFFDLSTRRDTGGSKKVGVIQCCQIEVFSQCETIGARD